MMSNSAHPGIPLRFDGVRVYQLKMGKSDSLRSPIVDMLDHACSSIVLSIIDGKEIGGCAITLLVM